KEARWYGSTATRYEHHPARLRSPTCLEVEWGVVPSARAFLDGLRRHTDIEPPVETSQDYLHLQTKNRDEQEKRLLELAEAGPVIVVRGRPVGRVLPHGSVVLDQPGVAPPARVVEMDRDGHVSALVRRDPRGRFEAARVRAGAGAVVAVLPGGADHPVWGAS